MKKLVTVLLSAVMLMTSGCGNVSELLEEEVLESPAPITTKEPVVQPTQEPDWQEQVDEVQTRIVISENLKMTNDWTLMGDYKCEITRKGEMDRVILGTSAVVKNGEMVWDDSQFWTVAVIAGDGAYNLFSQRMTGYVYVEVNEIFVRGVSTTAVTVYIFSGADREIRNYIFDGEAFVEHQIFNTKHFSTGGINNRYSNFPEYKPQ